MDLLPDQAKILCDEGLLKDNRNVNVDDCNDNMYLELDTHVLLSLPPLSNIGTQKTVTWSSTYADRTKPHRSRSCNRHHANTSSLPGDAI